MSEQTLSGRAALVTGSAKRIKRAVATLCGEDLANLTGQTIQLSRGIFLW